MPEVTVSHEFKTDHYLNTEWQREREIERERERERGGGGNNNIVVCVHRNDEGIYVTRILLCMTLWL